MLVAILACSPFKRKIDTGVAASCQLLFICIFMGGIMVRLYEDIANDSVGSPELAYRFLGLHSSDEAVTIMILVAFGMLVLVGLSLLGEAINLRVQLHIESKWSMCTVDPPHFRWKPRGVYACFLSHYKMESASDARYINDLLRKMLRAPVFLDASVLTDLRNLITEGVRKSGTLVLLATKGVLLRPWCLLELLETSTRNIPVIMIQMAHGEFTFENAFHLMSHLEEEMARHNPAGLEFLVDRLGDNLSELKEAA
eukprot:7388444-Prymnesium_polylepis.1